MDVEPTTDPKSTPVAPAPTADTTTAAAPAEPVVGGSKPLALRAVAEADQGRRSALRRRMSLKKREKEEARLIPPAQPILMALANRCLAVAPPAAKKPDAHWVDRLLPCWETLLLVLHTQRLSAHSCPDLLPALITHSQTHLLEQVLHCVHDIPEGQLVRIVQFVALHASPKPPNVFDEYIKCRNEALHVLRLVMCARRNNVFLCEAVRTMAVPETLLLLQYLIRFLELGQTRAKAGTRYSPFPNPVQVLDWVAVLLDGHLLSLALLPQCRALLSSLHQAITRLASEAHTFLALQTSLGAILRQLAMQQAAAQRRLEREWVMSRPATFGPKNGGTGIAGLAKEMPGEQAALAQAALPMTGYAVEVLQF
ncbi:hypothetical protein PAPYR_7972 [Paratrimastix pyriformis]|uniref:Nucleolar protein 11 C-terminal domain-containing protein n=1 Tax=Paratrimastix pyriformis TaxID=342808 RepID=A0ABQ8UBL1_9EUKA|nr:hypothetical protein PAPYR_7972 [Paratrimastix pyriformis]